MDEWMNGLIDDGVNQAKDESMNELIDSFMK